MNEDETMWSIAEKVFNSTNQITLWEKENEKIKSLNELQQENQQLKEKIDKTIKYIEDRFDYNKEENIFYNADDGYEIELENILKILKGAEVICFNQERYFTFEVDDIEGSDKNE